MTFSATLYTRKPRNQASRRQLTQQDLFVYEALLGKPAEFVEPTVETENPFAGLEPIKAVARRWRPALTQFTVNLRTMYHQGVTASAAHQQMTDWLRHMSDQAITRLDEAHARLNAARVTPPNRRRVVAREVSPVRSENGNIAVTISEVRELQYKRAA